MEGNATASASALEQDMYGQYAWEREVERWDYKIAHLPSDISENPLACVAMSWECLVEAEGQLRIFGGQDASSEENPGLSKESHIKRALLRSLVILIDATDGMRETDFKPDRLTCATQLLEAYAAAEVLCPPSAGLVTDPPGGLGTASAASSAPVFSGSPGFFSSNVEELRARALLGAVPPYCTREILVLYGSIRTCDVGSIDDSIAELKRLRVRCSVVSLAPEVRIVRALATQTEGIFRVAMHRDHLRSLLMEHTQPPAWLEGLQPCLIRVGFPSFKESSTAALCSCHSLPRFRAYTSLFLIATLSGLRKLEVSSLAVFKAQILRAIKAWR
ncbi:hypothetical protein Efla_003288 [Eimeria flavescens]